MSYTDIIEKEAIANRKKERKRDSIVGEFSARQWNEFSCGACECGSVSFDSILGAYNEYRNERNYW